MAKTLLKPQSPEKAQGQFGEAIEQAMKQKGYTISTLAEEMELTYEHTRRLIKSLAYPSKANLDRLCRILDLNKDEMRKLVTSDKLHTKYGDSAQEIFGQDPKLVRVNRDLLKLNKETFEMMTRMIAAAAKNQTVHTS